MLTCDLLPQPVLLGSRFAGQMQLVAIMLCCGCGAILTLSPHSHQGVMLEHRNAVAFLTNGCWDMVLPSDVIAQLTSPCFIGKRCRGCLWAHSGDSHFSQGVITIWWSVRSSLNAPSCLHKSDIIGHLVLTHLRCMLACACAAWERRCAPAFFLWNQERCCFAPLPRESASRDSRIFLPMTRLRRCLQFPVFSYNNLHPRSGRSPS